MCSLKFDSPRLLSFLDQHNVGNDTKLDHLISSGREELAIDFLRLVAENFRIFGKIKNTAVYFVVEQGKEGREALLYSGSSVKGRPIDHKNAILADTKKCYFATEKDCF